MEAIRQLFWSAIDRDCKASLGLTDRKDYRGAGTGIAAGRI